MPIGASRPPLLLVVLCSTLLAGCAARTGEIDLSVGFAPGGDPAQVSRVTALVLATDGSSLSPPVRADLARNAGRWEGTLSSIPSGERLLQAEAFATDGTRLYHGQAELTVVAGKTLLVFLQLLPEAASNDHAPYISSLTVSSISADFTQMLSLVATVGDPDPQDVPHLTYRWSATAGTFTGGTDVLGTTWTAPPGPQPLVVTLAFQVTDPSGLSATISIDIGVHAAGQTVTTTAVVNNFPRIDRATSSASVTTTGGVVSLDSSAHDPDSDALTYFWDTPDCPGLFLSPVTAPATQFQLGELPAGASCRLRVTIDDGRGGTDQAVLILTAGPQGTATLPLLDSVSNGGVRAFTGAPITLTLSAHDPGDATASLSFRWETSGATVDAIDLEPTSTRATLHVTPCSGAAGAVVHVSRPSSAAEVVYRFEIVTCPPSCRELNSASPGLPSGPYTIDLDGADSLPPLTVFCEMSAGGGGWTFVGHIGPSSSASSIFDVPAGTYSTARDPSTTYSLGRLPFLADTEMMITVDGPDPVDAASRQSLVSFEYPVGHPNFNHGPAPCTSLQPFRVRLRLDATYVTSQDWACTPMLWTPLDVQGRYLVQLGGPGLYLGGGLRTDGADQGWGHEAWIYVR